ncbi:hypothetical protein KKC88_04685 [Patescibacteria group bacterium]|nr:hypothetical protein [Patescibacteria group bacterium]MBU1673792.1 hypothetical protein [Patescibacteria group bacterium]MBU1963819.1 hypothetical protein [Patescibacteria group bacterium]
MSEKRPPDTKTKIALLKFLNIVIIVNFCIGIGYAAYRVFSTPWADMVTRRLYALESWTIIGFFSIYMALVYMRRLHQ